MYDRFKKLKKFQLQASLKHILALKPTSFFTSKYENYRSLKKKCQCKRSLHVCYYMQATTKHIFFGMKLKHKIFVLTTKL